MFELKKTSGPRKWWVIKKLDSYPFESNVIGCRTKKTALLWLDMFTSQTKESVRKLYLRLIEETEKMEGRKSATRSAMLSMIAFGIGPDIVNADPETGEPL